LILVLQTDTFGCFGGVPTYNRLVCRVLDEFELRDQNRVLIATDESEVVQLQGSVHPNLRLAGFGANRSKFVKAALGAVVRGEVELVLAGHVNYAPLCLILKLLRPRLKFGVVIYGWDVWFRLPLLRRFALRCADFLISISEYTKRQAVSINGVDAKRIWVLPNATERDAEDTVPTDSLERKQGTRILSVGRVDSSEQQKGFDTVISCLPAILKRVPDVQYIIVGSGTDLDRHKQLAREVGVSDRVQFLGTVADETLRQCYQSADIFVMPSAQEGFGFVYLEAMLYAKAIVAARSGGAPEVVEDGVTGQLVEYGNEDELTEALTELCLDAEKRARLGSAGYQRLQERFTFAHFKQKLTEILAAELASGTTSTAEVPVGRGTVETP
jgi:glycosyltransferase involved in cell wall biosynthesis